MKKSILELIKEGIILFDGANGSQLIKFGLPSGYCPELWNIEKPEIVKKIHQEYFQAGSDAVLTNTFGGNRLKLKAYSLENKVHELNLRGAKLAFEIKPENKFVGGDIGPTGKFLQPQGEYTQEEFEKIFYQQTLALVEGRVDFIMIETMYDIRETVCAVKGAKRATDLPIFASMTFKKTKRGFFTLMGNSVEQSVRELEKAGADGVGSNCTLNSQEMALLVKEMRKITSLPLIVQANAGQAILNPEGQIQYDQDAENYIKFVPEMIANGANIIGGCCGTDPEYIKKIAQILCKL
ncbi:MAG: homocysteine S-methyltransferase family protein [Candidatus Aminicenantia bacterium]